MSGSIETERLLVRPQTLDDVDALALILGDAQTMSFYPRPYTPEETRGWVERNISLHEERDLGLRAMVLKQTGELIGQCGFLPQDVDGEELVEIGWHVRRDHWRRGFATEAALALRDYAFEALDVDPLISLVRPENRPSAGVAEKLGMTSERITYRKGLLHQVYMLRNPNRS